MSTYFAAFDHDLTSYLAYDACISTQNEINDASWVVCKTLFEDTVRKYLESDDSAVGKPESESTVH
jgi:hypothetical protein